MTNTVVKNVVDEYFNTAMWKVMLMEKRKYIPLFEYSIALMKLK